ncbi:MAG: tyrosine-type recombinase/integrase [Roseburia sp.]|uniref:tyrosine-type recombinase/integrase n=1 Tax=Roseburia hominis TaxID=301301 RepID=UPI001F32D6DD|nr:tyrosine-type recombinase/integrase [Roseburia hominis]MCI5712485.1 tyrosine-type recombinase/integrase [Lachnospiraceae bacterium]
MNSNECNIDGVKCTKEELLEATERAMISKNDVLKELELMRREKILLKHTEKYKIWLADDGRWKTKIPDGSKYGKLVARATKENLENFIVDFYIKSEKEEVLTMERIYPKWIEFKYLSSGKGTANKAQWVWDTYYKGSSIVKEELSKLTVGKLSHWLLKLVDDKKLTKKKYMEVKGVMNQLFDYCISEDIIQINLPRQIRFPSKNIFAETEKKPEAEVIYSAETKSEVISEALAQFEKTRNTAYLAVCLNFNLALRVGELVAIRESDIESDVIHIVRGEVKEYDKDAQGKIYRSGYKIVPHTKTDAGIRTLILTPDAKKYIKMAIDENKANGLKDEDYIFVSKTGERMHDYAVNNVLRRCNGVRNEKDRFIISGKPSGNHAIRKTCISELHDSQLLPDRMISDFAGHKDISTTQKYYIHSVTPLTEKADVFAKVFGSKAM